MIYVLLANGFEEIEALTPVDMLRRAGSHVKTVSIEDGLVVHGAHGIDVVADVMPADASDKIDLLILPGGMPGSLNLDASPVTDDMLRRVTADGGRIAAICAAPLVLGRRGLLKGKLATCYPGFEKELEGAIVRKEPVVTDGLITTARGMGAAMTFGAELVKWLHGKEEAKRMLRGVCSSGRLSVGVDELLPTAIDVVLETGMVGITILQRKMSIGFGKAARLIELMEEKGIVGPPNGQGPREILVAIEKERAASSDESLPTELARFLPQAIEIALEAGKVSSSLLQRKMAIGFGKAARLIDLMEEKGIVGPPDGQGPREVLVTAEEYRAKNEDK